MMIESSQQFLTVVNNLEHFPTRLMPIDDVVGGSLLDFFAGLGYAG